MTSDHRFIDSLGAAVEGRDAMREGTPAALRALVRDGRIAEWQVYADNEPIREQMRAASV